MAACNLISVYISVSLHAIIRFAARHHSLCCTLPFVLLHFTICFAALYNLFCCTPPFVLLHFTIGFGALYPSVWRKTTPGDHPPPSGAPRRGGGSLSTLERSIPPQNPRTGYFEVLCSSLHFRSKSSTRGHAWLGPPRRPSAAGRPWGAPGASGAPNPCLGATKVGCMLPFFFSGP